MSRKPLAGSLEHRMSGTDHLVFVPGIGHVIADPHVRAELLLQDWEQGSPASTGPFPWGPSVLHSAQKCADPVNQPIGLAWVRSLVLATVNAHKEP